MTAGTSKTITLPAQGDGQPPANATAVVVNVTAVAPSGAGWFGGVGQR
jgi:hypothetical protein